MELKHECIDFNYGSTTSSLEVNSNSNMHRIQWLHNSAGLVSMTPLPLITYSRMALQYYPRHIFLQQTLSCADTTVAKEAPLLPIIYYYRGCTN